MIGALAVGLLCVPVFGFHVTCWILAALKASSAVMLILGARWSER